jgi:hypothetical protein
MVSDGQLHVAEWKLMAAAYVHRVAVAALGAEVIDDLVIRNDNRPALFRDRRRIADVITVPVSQEDGIQFREMISPDVGQRVSA